MNLLLHGIGAEDADSPIAVDDSLKADPGVRYHLVLTNPPFGKRSSMTVVNAEGETEREDLLIVRDDFWASTSNKQLNFLQHVKTLLKIGGRAAIVVPDNVLFEGGAGETVRRKLLHECDVHTLLRLPTGIFYAQGVKANVLFFERRPASEAAATSTLWVYDLRTNMHFTLKQSPLRYEHLEDFVRAFNPDDRRARTESERFRPFTYEELLQRGQGEPISDASEDTLGSAGGGAWGWGRPTGPRPPCLFPWRPRCAVHPPEALGVSLRQAGDEWLRRLETQQQSESTLVGYRVAIDDLLDWSETNGREVLTETAIVDYLHSYQQRAHPAEASYYWRFVLLRKFVRWVCRRDGVPDPFLDLDAPPKPRQERDWLTPEEFRRLLDAARHPVRNLPGLAERDQLVLLTLVLTGLRRSELCALDWRDLGMTHNEVCHSSDRPQSGSRNLAYLRSTLVTLLDQGGEKGESDEREPEDVERGAEIGVVHFDGTCRDRAERTRRFRSGLEDRPVDELVSKT